MTATEELKTFANLRTTLATLINDNDNEEVTPEDVRDWLLDLMRSVAGPHGMLASSSPITPMSVALTGSFSKIGTWGTSAGLDLTISTAAGTFTIPAEGGGTYRAGFHVTAAPPAACILDFVVRKTPSGGAVADTIVYGFGCTQPLAPFCVNLSQFGEVAGVGTGDTFELWAKSSVNHTVPMHIQFLVQRLVS